jgi:PEP-CTERM motif
MRIRLHALKAISLSGLLLSVGTATASASTIAIGSAALGPGSTLTTFTGLPNLAEVNGLSVNGILFGYSLGNGQVVLDGGPGATNNISPLNIVSTGNNSGILSMSLPGYAGSFGFGFAVLATVPLANAVTISLFDGATLVGSMNYAGAPDPIFTGGFAGIQSTIAFNNVQVVFNSTNAPAFALDNIRTAAAVPEPGTWLLLGTGLAAVAARRRFTTRT